MTDEQIREWLARLDRRCSWRGDWDKYAEVVRVEWQLNVDRELPAWTWPVLADESERHP